VGGLKKVVCGFDSHTLPFPSLTASLDSAVLELAEEFEGEFDLRVAVLRLGEDGLRDPGAVGALVVVKWTSPFSRLSGAGIPDGRKSCAGGPSRVVR
jgi:hypothetical protein